MTRFSVAIKGCARRLNRSKRVLLFATANGRPLSAVDGADMDLSFTPERERLRLRLRRTEEHKRRLSRPILSAEVLFSRSSSIARGISEVQLNRITRQLLGLSKGS